MSYWFADPLLTLNHLASRPPPSSSGGGAGGAGAVLPLRHRSHSSRARLSVLRNWPLVLNEGKLNKLDGQLGAVHRKVCDVSR